MRILVIETSGTEAELVLADSEGLLARRKLTAARKHARDLAPAIKDLLGEHEVRPSELNLLLVDLGPGSYTGLRVGITTAKIFCYATGAEVVGIDTMTVLAEFAPADATRIGTLVDAQQGLVYTAFFERVSPSDPPTLQQPIAIVPADRWAGELAPGTYITGPALERYSELVPEHCTLAPPAARAADACALMRVGMRVHAAGRRDDLYTLEPLYLRPSAAEQKSEGSSQRSATDGGKNSNWQEE